MTCCKQLENEHVLRSRQSGWVHPPYLHRVIVAACGQAEFAGMERDRAYGIQVTIRGKRFVSTTGMPEPAVATPKHRDNEARFRNLY